MDLSSVVSAFAVAGGLTVTRPSSAVFTDGVMTSVGGTSTVRVNPAVVYPLPNSRFDVLPEGQRTFEPVEILSIAALRGAKDPSGNLPDRFSWQGVTYEVQIVDRWVENANFYRSVAIKIPVT